jgi:hypothetical protein
VLPVDVTATSIVHLSRESDHLTDHVYHLIDRRNRLPMDAAIDALHGCDKGMRMVERYEWARKVQQLCAEKIEYECVEEFLINWLVGDEDGR